jgi:hypothetical protein
VPIPPIDTALAMIVLRERRDWTLAQLAIEIVCAGYDAPKLRQFAASVDDFYAKDDDWLLRAALDELGMALPSDEQAATHLARCAAQDIVEGRIEPHEGAERMREIARAVRYGDDTGRITKALYPFFDDWDWSDAPRDRPRVDPLIRDAARQLLDTLPQRDA